MCQGFQVLVGAHIVTYSQSNFHHWNDVCVHFRILKSFVSGQMESTSNEWFNSKVQGETSAYWSRNDVYLRKSLLHSQLMLIQGEFTILIYSTHEMRGQLHTQMFKWKISKDTDVQTQNNWIVHELITNRNRPRTQYNVDTLHKRKAGSPGKWRSLYSPVQHRSPVNLSAPCVLYIGQAFR